MLRQFGATVLVGYLPMPWKCVQQLSVCLSQGAGAAVIGDDIHADRQRIGRFAI